MTLLRTLCVLAGAALIVVARTPGPAAAEDTLRASSMLPRTQTYAAHFVDWVSRVNDRGKGIVTINFIGGPEAVPTFEQAEAARGGVVHMVFGPATYYLGLIPEIDALVGSNVTPWERRQNGGIDLLNKIHQEKLGVYYLGQADFIEFHIYTKRKPTLRADGSLDLSGLKLRGGPIYREFFTGLGANFVNIPAPEVYTALERGTVDGVGWPKVGIGDFSWDKHVRFRVDPGFFASDVGIIVNLARWNALSQRAREFLQAAAIEYERESFDHFMDLSNKADQDMRARGIEIVPLSGAGAAQYREAAARVPWERLKSRGSPHYETLRAKFYRE
jgi:TRAP-type C4-dicarboxylate transport system substrate-binding protein